MLALIFSKALYSEVPSMVVLVMVFPLITRLPTILTNGTTILTLHSQQVLIPAGTGTVMNCWSIQSRLANIISSPWPATETREQTTECIRGCKLVLHPGAQDF